MRDLSYKRYYKCMLCPVKQEDCPWSLERGSPGYFVLDGDGLLKSSNDSFGNCDWPEARGLTMFHKESLRSKEQEPLGHRLHQCFSFFVLLFTVSYRSVRQKGILLCQVTNRSYFSSCLSDLA